MFYKATSILIIFTSAIVPSLQQQNLCGLTATFVQDPSHCERYLFCDRPASGSPISVVHQMTCLNTGGPWFLPDESGSGTCQESNEHCVAPLAMCPPFPEPDIMIAIHGDPTCRLFRPCRLPGAAGTPCTPPLVFNRNSGTCDFEQNAPCEVHGEGGGGGGPLPTCEPGATGTFPGRTCYEFIFCFDGIMSGPFHCGPGLIFDQSAGGCVIDTAGACPRTRLLTIPRAKVITDSIERKIPERFNRF